MNSDLCLDVKHGSDEAGEIIQQDRCHGGGNQRWVLELVELLIGRRNTLAVQTLSLEATPLEKRIRQSNPKPNNTGGPHASSR